MHRDATREGRVLQEVAGDEAGPIVEKGPARAEDRWVDEQQKLVEESVPQELGRDRGPAHADVTLCLLAKLGELLSPMCPDRTVGPV